MDAMASAICAMMLAAWSVEAASSLPDGGLVGNAAAARNPEAALRRHVRQELEDNAVELGRGFPRGGVPRV